MALISMAGWMLVTTTRPRLDAMAKRLRHAARRCPTPMVMMTLLAIVPHVVSCTSGRASSSDAAVCVAPNSMAFSRLFSSGSMAKIRLAPASLAPWMALAPMPPTPTTTTLSPGCTSAAYTDDPQPVTTPQPSRQARSSGTSSSILMQLASLTTVWWPNVPSRHMSPRSWPWRGGATVPSAICRPTPRSGAEVAQVLVAGRAARAPTAGRDEAEHDVVAGLEPAHAFADLLARRRRPRGRR